MNFKESVRQGFDYLKKFWRFLKKDTWQSWIVSLILAFIIIKFVFFPVLSLIMGTSLPLVVVESCSMYHVENDFEDWWESNNELYKSFGISKRMFESFPFKNGLNKGDIILVKGEEEYELGEIIIFNSVYKFPVIHRLVDNDPYGTKGDNGKTNFHQLPDERYIEDDKIIGKAVTRIPGLGWIKLIFFEGVKDPEQRGFC